MNKKKKKIEKKKNLNSNSSSNSGCCFFCLTNVFLVGCNKHSAEKKKKNKQGTENLS